MNNSPENNEKEENNMIDVVSETADLISDVASGIPAPIKKNFLKAFGQLCTAAVDIPVAHLEGRAAEIRAESKARIEIIGTGSAQISAKMNVDQKFIESAANKYAQRIVREQINKDDVVRIAASEIKTNPAPNISEESKVEDISTDWLNTFEREVGTKSSEEMKLLFGKILAGETQQPNSFSIKTLKTLSQLDHKIANTFLRLSSLCTQVEAGGKKILVIINSLGKQAGANGLMDYGITFTDLSLLSEYGLIPSELSISGFYDFLIEGSLHSKGLQLPFTIQGRSYRLYPKPDRNMDEKFKLSGVGLSNTGFELLSILEPQANDKYIQDLKKYFEGKHLDMVEI